MISPAGWFSYRVVLQRRGSDWIGQAEPGEQHGQHPGLVGARPQVVLNAGVLTLRCSESLWRRLRTPAYRTWGTPVRAATLDIGSAIERVAEPGDALHVTRGGTGDHGAILLRDARLVIALGNVARLTSQDITVTEDPRLDEEHLYGVRRALDDPQTTFAWVDAEDSQLESTLQNLATLPGPRRVIAHRAGSDQENSRLNMRIFQTMPHRFEGSVECVPVDAQFKTSEQWLAYVRALPEGRPDDLHIRFTAPGVDVTLHEGEYALRSSWHIFVQRIRRFGIPGHTSHVAVAREHPRLDEDSIRNATRQIASGAIQISH